MEKKVKLTKLTKLTKLNVNPIVGKDSIMEMDRLPKPGEIYNHFKGNPYQIITVATHTETGEKMVVYQALYGDFKTFVRPLSMFLSEVDRGKYPTATQTYRFELRKDNLDQCDSKPVGSDFLDGKMKEGNLENNISEGTTKSNEVINNKTEVDNRSEVNIKSEVDNKSEVINKDEVDKKTEADNKTDINSKTDIKMNEINQVASDIQEELNSENINAVLLQFLDASSYTKKLEIVTSNTKHLTDRIINDMAVSLDCTVEEGPIEERIHGLVYCLQAMRRFEDRRLR